ncbi:hypothetical protein ACNF40_07040 [Cuniculiplasma sp. SKW4]|uniref:hypothetical protein n=1 Tax=Cuniculiplasma sp. SKW4 TaxID=3400171 RepID=UPI003FD14E7A
MITLSSRSPVFDAITETFFTAFGTREAAMMYESSFSRSKRIIDFIIVLIH